MPPKVLTDATVTINGVDLSDHVRAVKVDATASDEEFTAMGATGKARLAGLRDDMFEIEFNQDYDVASVDATLFPLVGAAPFPVTARSDSAAVSATNPSYEGSCILLNNNPLDASVGSPLLTSASMPVTGVISRVVV